MKAIKRNGDRTWVFHQTKILGTGVVVGPKEKEGPLGDDFPISYDDIYIGQDTFEKAERQLLAEAAKTAITNAKLKEDQIDLFLAGDLLNQIVSANFVAKELELPFMGMFGACSTSMETLATASALVSSGFSNYVLAGCCSHNATAERQFRYPTEYGGQKPPYSQWTATGAGAAVVGKGTSGIMVTHATIGKVVDMGIKDPFDMGRAMAPAAADTIAAHLQDTQRSPHEYDLIVTGDLANVGSPILIQLLRERNIDIANLHRDCGSMLYDPSQEVNAGGSGCAASAIVTYGHLLKEMERGKYQRILVVATGALFSPVTFQQGESIPCTAHAVAFERKEAGEENG